ncbi:NADPH-dependent FMN reductase [Saccharopolyspora sp. NPDC050389]|uniref:NADPH-dependent FMN reductase n=1 Tax=Saccharopolyspora sp. NPDC050389 TaxID=3155516 RepID=UPI0033DAECF1
MVEILLVMGSTRSGSTNTAALRTALEVAPDGVAVALYEGLAAFPAFNPDQDTDSLPAPAADLRGRIASADAVLFCTPEYAGTLPGSFKNLLDWTVGGPEMHEKPVAWVNVAAEGRGNGASETLRTVLGYLSTDVVEPACVRLTVPRGAVGPAETIEDPRIREGLRDILRTIAKHVTARG